jgi:hypothetical protein
MPALKEKVFKVMWEYIEEQERLKAKISPGTPFHPSL